MLLDGIFPALKIDGDGAYSDALMCDVIACINDGEETVIFLLAKGHFSDMDGAVRLAEMINKDVVRILSFDVNGIGAYYTKLNTLDGWQPQPLDMSEKR